MIQSISNYNADNPLVSICCATYNHEKFIADALDGFLKQKTDFPVEILINDDCSIDTTADIIQQYKKKYPNIIKPVFQVKNQYSLGIKPISQILLPRSKGRYIAICDGDDYWTDESKLQKQINFLEEHLEYNLCGHNWKVDDNGDLISSGLEKAFKKSFSFTFDTLPWIWITHPSTLVFRNNAFDYNELKKYRLRKDVHLIYHLLINGKGYYMPEIMAIYRMHKNGVWSKIGILKQKETSYKVYGELNSFDNRPSVKKRFLNASLIYFNTLIYSSKTRDDLKKALQIFSHSFRLIQDLTDFVLFVGSLFPPQMINLVRSIIKK